MLQRRPTDFAHRNLLLQVLLGLKSMSERLDVVLERHVPAEAERDAATEADDLTLAILGAVAIQRRLEHHLARLDPAEPPPVAPEGPPPEDLLR